MRDDTSAITADPRNPVGYMWYWTDDKGLVKIDVPAPIFNELMAMRACEYSLKLGGSQGDALSLWLASNYKREVELPQGQVDPTRAPGQPDAHYYGVSAGAQYLNAALARTLRQYGAPDSEHLPELEDTPDARRANADLVQATQAHDRASELFKRTLISQQALDDAKAALQSKRAIYNSATQNAKNLRPSIKASEATMKVAARQLRDTGIRAPFDGVVQKCLVNMGAFVKTQ